MQNSEQPGASTRSPRRWKAKSSTTERENPLQNTTISAEGFVMFVFRGCASKGYIFCDVNKMLHHSVTVARREQNACRDVNRMMDFALALLPELLWLSCPTPFSEHQKCKATQQLALVTFCLLIQNTSCTDNIEYDRKGNAYNLA